MRNGNPISDSSLETSSRVIPHSSFLIPNCLSIAASDPTGGAGIQSDLATFHRFGARGCSVITAITAQNSNGVSGVWPVDADAIEAQLEALATEYQFDAIKIGALCSLDAVHLVSKFLERIQVPVILDPVIRPTRGIEFLSSDETKELVLHLFPRVTLLTPNISEAEQLLGRDIVTFDDMHGAAEALLALGPKSILLKGGHLASGNVVRDLYFEGGPHWFESDRIDAELHGTGCKLSSAIAAALGAGNDLLTAIDIARKYVRELLTEHSRSLEIS